MGVFGGTQKWAGSSRAEQMKFQIGGVDVAGMVLQNVQFSFTQQVNMLYEIGSGNVYFVGGRAQGSASVARIIGPGVTQLKLINTYKNICKPADMTLNSSSGCDNVVGQGIKYTLKNAVLVSIGVSVNSNDVLVNEQLQLMFADLEMASQ